MARFSCFFRTGTFFVFSIWLTISGIARASSGHYHDEYQWLSVGSATIYSFYAAMRMDTLTAYWSSADPYAFVTKELWLDTFNSGTDDEWVEAGDTNGALNVFYNNQDPNPVTKGFWAGSFCANQYYDYQTGLWNYQEYGIDYRPPAVDAEFQLSATNSVVNGYYVYNVYVNGQVRCQVLQRRAYGVYTHAGLESLRNIASVNIIPAAGTDIYNIQEYPGGSRWFYWPQSASSIFNYLSLTDDTPYYYKYTPNLWYGQYWNLTYIPYDRNQYPTARFFPQ